ncbi:MAG TPA: response regulator, partial [Nitrospiria bacterium]|nr:response regulator [Nitrospiria bacterium]
MDSPQQKPVILVVDDDERISSLVQSSLQANNFSTVSAQDGEEALSLWKENNPDLVILDIMLPKIDGIEVCRRIRAESEVPILMLT